MLLSQILNADGSLSVVASDGSQPRFRVGLVPQAGDVFEIEAAVFGLHSRGTAISHETVRFEWNRFGPMPAAEVRRRRVDRIRARKCLDEVYLKFNGVLTTSSGPLTTRAKFWKASHQNRVL